MRPISFILFGVSVLFAGISNISSNTRFSYVAFGVFILAGLLEGWRGRDDTR